MKFRKKNAKRIGRDGIDGWIYSTKEDFKSASAAYFEVTGKKGSVKSTLSDKVYYIVDGSGKFEIDGKLILVAKYDVVIVPKNTPYNYWATNCILRLFLVHTPAFDEKSETQLE